MASWKRWLPVGGRQGARAATPVLGSRSRLGLETLEGRLVPSGTPFDLTTRGAEQTIGGAIFRQTDAQPTGTGAINSFVRLQNAKNAPVEQGYNTSARPLQFDENNSPQFTRSLRLSDVPQVTIGGKVYLEFLLDINQSKSQPLLSLDELRVYVADQADLTGYDAGTKTLAGNAPVYDLDATGDNWLKMNYSLNHGSGSGDVLAYVPFPTTVRDGNPYLYLYSKFGTNIAANAGFEEWAVRSGNVSTPPGSPPPPSSLSGFVYLDANNDGVFEQDETPIAGATITLTATDDLGRTVSIMTTTTDENGFYSFSNLAAGHYRLAETQPTDPNTNQLYLQGQDTIGTQGGTTGNDYFDITLAWGVNGLFNNFGERIDTLPPPPPINPTT